MNADKRGLEEENCSDFIWFLVGLFVRIRVSPRVYALSAAHSQGEQAKAWTELPKMLTHVVIWKYKSDIEQEVREEHVRMLRSLAAVIKQVETLVVGFDVVKLPRSFDTGLVATFRDRAALDAYTVHPEHIKVAALGKTISEQVASVDFES
jgi:quinol monooxygenase YgiN